MCGLIQRLQVTLVLLALAPVLSAQVPTHAAPSPQPRPIGVPQHVQSPAGSTSGHHQAAISPVRPARKPPQPPVPVVNTVRIGVGYAGYPWLGTFGYAAPPLASDVPYWDEEDEDLGPTQEVQYGAPPSSEVAENGPAYYRPAYAGPAPDAPVSAQPATTLVFEDGRPSLQVHNYALIGNTLYALDGDTRQEIPLSQLNLPATVEANRKAGVDFSPPGSH
jgi:hypothetical protein